MKHVVVVLSVLVFLGSLGMSAYGETGNAYPPPRRAAANGGVTATAVGASAPSGGEMIADLVLVRPMSLLACVVGVGLTVISLPFSAASHTTDQVNERLMNEPFRFTFARPLGEF